MDICGATHDDLRYGQAAYQSREHITRPLGQQLAIRRRHALLGIELVGRLEAQKRLEARNKRKGQRRDIHSRIPELGPIGRHQQAAGLGQTLQNGNMHEVVGAESL